MTLSRSRSHYVAVAALVAVGFVLLLPVGAVYLRAIALSEANESEPLFQLGRQLPLLMRSLTVAVGSSIIASILGVLVGIAAVRAGAFARTALGGAAALSLLTPPYVFAIAWIDLWGPSGWLYRWTPAETMRLGDTVYTVPGAAVALAAAYYPIVAVATYIALRRVDRRWREAASIAGRSRFYFTSISLPVIARPIAAGSIVVFLLALYDFPVHSLLQVNTYLVELYAASEYHDYRAATLLSIPLVVMAGASIACASALVRQRGNVSDAGMTNDTVHGGKLWWDGLGWCVVFVASVLPILVVTVRAMPPTTFVRLFQTAWQELGSSLVLAAIAATLITILGTVSSILLPGRRARTAVDLMSAVPFLISGPLLGLGLIAVYNRPGLPGVIYDSAAILLLAWLARYGFIAQWGIGAGIRGQAPSGNEAARVAGVPWFRIQAGVVVAQARPYIAMVWGAAFILTFREIDTAVLVAPPGLTLASVRLFTLMHYGPDGYVMAMALTMSAVIFAAGALMFAFAGQWKRISDART